MSGELFCAHISIDFNLYILAETVEAIDKNSNSFIERLDGIGCDLMEMENESDEKHDTETGTDSDEDEDEDPILPNETKKIF